MCNRGLYKLTFSIVSLLLFSSFCIAKEKPKLALVIDDLGYSLLYGQQAFELKGNHTYAIIPNTIYADKLSSIGHKNGKELIMHLPMQSSSHTVNHEADALNDHMSETKLIAITQKYLNNMPHISGINNHMGSHLTQFDYFMRPIMETIFKHNPNLYFLDSRTSAKSKAYTVARRSGLAASKRTIFIDHNHAASDIKHQFKAWLKKARNGRSAIAIAHPSKSTLSVLAPLLEAEKDNYDFVTLSQYLSIKQEITPWQNTYLSLLRKDVKTSKPSH